MAEGHAPTYDTVPVSSTENWWLDVAPGHA